MSTSEIVYEEHPVLPKEKTKSPRKSKEPSLERALGKLAFRMELLEKGVTDIELQVKQNQSAHEESAYGLEAYVTHAMALFWEQLREMQAEFKMEHKATKTKIAKLHKELKIKTAILEKATTSCGSLRREAALKVKYLEPKPFNGMRDEMEVDFIWNIEQYLQAVRIEDEADKVNTISLNFTDDAMP